MKVSLSKLAWATVGGARWRSYLLLVPARYSSGRFCRVTGTRRGRGSTPFCFLFFFLFFFHFFFNHIDYGSYRLLKICPHEHSQSSYMEYFRFNLHKISLLSRWFWCPLECQQHKPSTSGVSGTMVQSDVYVKQIISRQLLNKNEKSRIKCLAVLVTT